MPKTALSQTATRGFTVFSTSALSSFPSHFGVTEEVAITPKFEDFSSVSTNLSSFWPGWEWGHPEVVLQSNGLQPAPLTICSSAESAYVKSLY